MLKKQKLIEVALGEKKADLLIKNAKYPITVYADPRTLT